MIKTPDALEARGEMKRLLELDLVRTLIIVSEQGSFTRAANLLNRTQAAVSMQVRRLEELCGSVLIARGKREFRLTDEGQVLVDYGRRMLDLNEQALDDLSPDAVAGVVRIAVPDQEAVHVLPALLAEFAGLYPRTQIELQSGVRPHEVLDTLNGLNLDLMIALEPTGSASGVVLRTERAVWATSASHAPHTKDPLPVALLKDGSLLRFWALASLSQSGRAWHEAYSSASGLSLLAALEAGFAVGVVRETSLHEGLRELTEDEGFRRLPSFDITLLRASVGLGRAAQALQAFLLDRLAAIGRPDVPKEPT